MRLLCEAGTETKPETCHSVLFASTWYVLSKKMGSPFSNKRKSIFDNGKSLEFPFLQVSRNKHNEKRLFQDSLNYLS